MVFFPTNYSDCLFVLSLEEVYCMWYMNSFLFRVPSKNLQNMCWEISWGEMWGLQDVLLLPVNLQVTKISDLLICVSNSGTLRKYFLKWFQSFWNIFFLMYVYRWLPFKSNSYICHDRSLQSLKLVKKPLREDLWELLRCVRGEKRSELRHCQKD